MKFTTRDITFIALFVALMAIGAKITIPSPIVPFTMQYMFVVLSGMLLGPRLGFASMVVYMLLGLIGVPVFAKGGGIGYILTPTFGYLVGFIVASYSIGKMTEKLKGKLSFIHSFLISVIGLFIVYTIGVAYMLLIKNFYIGSALSFSKAVWYGAALFIPTDLMFCVLCAMISTKTFVRVKKIIK